MNIEKTKITLDENGKIKINTIYPLKDIMQSLVDYINDIEQENTRLKKELSEYSKDEEIKKYKEQAEIIRLNSLYMFDDTERERVKEFSRQHYEKCGRAGRIRYIITPTAIGTAVEVECAKCKEKKDVSNFNNW